MAFHYKILALYQIPKSQENSVLLHNTKVFRTFYSSTITLSIVNDIVNCTSDLGALKNYPYGV
jgi:hypothetical protein